MSQLGPEDNQSNRSKFGREAFACLRLFGSLEKAEQAKALADTDKEFTFGLLDLINDHSEQIHALLIQIGISEPEEAKRLLEDYNRGRTAFLRMASKLGWQPK